MPIKPYDLAIPIPVVGMAEGITEVGRQKALFQTEALQSAIFNSANFSSIATDAKGVIQIFNVGAERMLGYAAAEVMNKITPADISDPQEVIARATALSLELGTPITPGFEALVFKASRGIEDIYELTYIRKDGSRFPAVVSVTALRDEQDEIIGYLLIGTDNTTRKQAEEVLRTSEERFKTMFVQGPLGIAMIDSLTGHIYEANSRYVEIVGRSMEEMSNIDWIQITHPDDVQADLAGHAGLYSFLGNKANRSQSHSRKIVDRFQWVTLVIRTQLSIGLTLMAIVAGVVALIGCERTPVTPPVTLRIGVYQGQDYLLYFVMQEQGFVKKNGLNFTVSPVVGGAAAIDAMATGAMDLSIAGFVPVLVAAGSGVIPDKVVPVAANNFADPEHRGAGVLIANTLQGWKDFEGKKIATNARDSVLTAAADVRFKQEDVRGYSWMEIPLANAGLALAGGDAALPRRRITRSNGEIDHGQTQVGNQT